MRSSINLLVKFSKIVTTILTTIILLFTTNISYAAPATASATFAERPEVQAFLHELTSKHQLEYNQLYQDFNKFAPSQEIIAKISRPAEDLPWHKYRALLITEQRIKDGIAFWQQHKRTLQQAERRFGVPAEIIVAIIGVETFYGKNTGKYPVLQALATLAFDYPKRANFFKNELEQYLLLCNEEQLPVTELKGSYAGAIGVPQFIPSSYRNFAVDFSNIGKKDLTNIDTAIGSVANYLHAHGWQYRQDIAYLAKISGNKPNQQLPLAEKNNPKPILTMADLKQHGIAPQASKIFNINNNAKFALLELAQSDQNEYWLGRDNFYAITRYNHSVLYAMAVYQLSQELKFGHDPILN